MYVLGIYGKEKKFGSSSELINFSDRFEPLWAFAQRTILFGYARPSVLTAGS
jgi:hypothetical protein